MKIIAVAGRMGTGKDTVAEILASKGYQRVAFADTLKQVAHHVFGFDRNTLFGPSGFRNKVVRFNDEEWCDIFFRGGAFADKMALIMQMGSRAGSNAPFVTGLQVRAAFHRYLKDCRAVDHELGFSARVALQLLGTEFGRALRDDVWVVNLESAVYEIDFGYAYDPLTGVNYNDFAPKSIPTGVVITDCRFRNEAEAIRRWGGQVYWIDASKRLVIPTSTHASEPDREVFDGLLDGVLNNNGTVEELAEEVQRVIVG